MKRKIKTVIILLLISLAFQTVGAYAIRSVYVKGDNIIKYTVRK